MSSATRTSILFATLGAIACLSSFALAQTPPASSAAPQPSCPATYEHLIDRLCFHRRTGDIVLAEEPAERRTFTSADCRPRYTILLGSLCFDDVSGDIELPNDGAATTAAR